MLGAGADGQPVRDRAVGWIRCACGLSKKQPWCDGAHKTTALKPIVFTAEEGKLWMCGCKATNTKPFCDGSHNTV